MKEDLIECINVIEKAHRGSRICLVNGKSFTSSLSPVQFLQRCFALRAQDMESAKNYCRQVTGFSQKPPVILWGKRPILFFSTRSDTHEECLFVHYQNVRKIIKKQSGSVILFEDGTSYGTQIDPRILHKQMERSRKYLELIEENQRNGLSFLQIQID